MDVILACRSEERGAAARQLLIRELAPSCPGVADRVHLMLVDVANLSSVRAFCGQFQQRCAHPYTLSCFSGSSRGLFLLSCLAPRFDRLDFLFCNAGVMSIKSYNWSTLFSALFTCRLGYFLETGRFVLIKTVNSNRLLISHSDCRAFSTGPHFIRQNTPAITADGVDDVFATHVLGHFAMVASWHCLTFLVFCANY